MLEAVDVDEQRAGHARPAGARRARAAARRGRARARGWAARSACRAGPGGRARGSSRRTSDSARLRPVASTSTSRPSTQAQQDPADQQRERVPVAEHPGRGRGAESSARSSRCASRLPTDVGVSRAGAGRSAPLVNATCESRLSRSGSHGEARVTLERPGQHDLGHEQLAEPSHERPPARGHRRGHHPTAVHRGLDAQRRACSRR